MEFGLKEERPPRMSKHCPQVGGGVGCLSDRQASPAQAPSLDNPELFREEDHKKINRWADNLALSPRRRERGLTGDRKVPECVRERRRRRDLGQRRRASSGSGSSSWGLGSMFLFPQPRNGGQESSCA